MEAVGVTFQLRQDTATAAGEGFIVGIGNGEWGGTLMYVSPEGELRMLEEGNSIEDVLRVGSEAVAFVRASRSHSEVACAVLDVSQSWKIEEDRFSTPGLAVLGADGLGAAIAASDMGPVFAFDCSGSSPEELATVSIGPDFHRLAGESGSSNDCIVGGAITLTSARRFANGTVAVTTRHHLVLIDGAGNERWYRRSGECERDRLENPYTP